MCKIKPLPLNNMFIIGETNASKGINDSRRILSGKPSEPTYDDVHALMYFEYKEGKQMLADGYSFKDLHPAMQSALKYGKKYLDKSER